MEHTIPQWLKAELELIGVREPKPKNPTPSSKPETYVPWKPTYPGEEPPF